MLLDKDMFSQHLKEICFDIDTFKELTKLYPEHEAILSGVKQVVIYSDSISK